MSDLTAADFVQHVLNTKAHPIPADGVYRRGRYSEWRIFIEGIIQERREQVLQMQKNNSEGS